MSETADLSKNLMGLKTSPESAMLKQVQSNSSLSFSLLKGCQWVGSGIMGEKISLQAKSWLRQEWWLAETRCRNINV